MTWPVRRRRSFLEHLACPALGVAVRCHELVKGVRLADLLAQLVQHEVEELEQLAVARPFVASSLQAASPLLPLLARNLDLAHSEQHRSGQRGSASATIASPSWPRDLSLVLAAAFDAYQRGAIDYEP